MQLRTELDDRTLRYDGVSIVDPDAVPSALLRGVHPCQLRVTHTSPDVEQFNERVTRLEQLLLDHDEPVSIDLKWELPPEYLAIDLTEYMADKAADYVLTLSEPDQFKALTRVAAELIEITKRGMVEFFKTIIYVLDTFRANGTVWGVGRGSSCASYILFILGLHCVDCVRYNVPMSEFFHD